MSKLEEEDQHTGCCSSISSSCPGSHVSEDSWLRTRNVDRDFSDVYGMITMDIAKGGRLAVQAETYFEDEPISSKEIASTDVKELEG
ncbi:hypothetical protein JB92DRAFT_3143031 [Gautieria morchelliformis]|nr:hypothetical protein JB92DRAFT_3143031 [Gautieria morchelliformis]